MKYFFLLLSLFLFISPAQAIPNDWLIIPGKRVGPITANTSEADLIRWFGKKNVLHEKHLVITDAVEEPATILYPNDLTRRLIIFWKNKNIDMVKVIDEKSK